MSCYFVAQIEIHDREEYQSYLAGTDALLERFGGEVQAVDDHVVVLEGEWPGRRTVIIRFQDQDAARRWYRSRDYQELARHRFRAADSNAVLVRGRE